MTRAHANNAVITDDTILVEGNHLFAPAISVSGPSPTSGTVVERNCLNL